MSLLDRIPTQPDAERLYELASDDPAAVREHLGLVLNYARSGDASERELALKTLELVAAVDPDPVVDNVEVLRAGLGDDRPAVRAAAIDALAPLPPETTTDEGTLSSLLVALKRGTGQEQVAAARTLGDVAAEVLARDCLAEAHRQEMTDLAGTSANVLINALRGDVDEYQQAAIEGLSNVAVNEPELVAGAGETLGAALRESLTDPDRRPYAAPALAATAEQNPAVVRPVVDELVDCLERGGSDVQTAAARALTPLSITDPEATLPAVEELGACLDEGGDAARWGATALAHVAVDHPLRVADAVDGLERRDLYVTTPEKAAETLGTVAGVEDVAHISTVAPPSDDTAGSGSSSDSDEPTYRPGAS